MSDPTPTSITSNVVLKLPKPSYVILESPDGQSSYREDSLVIRRMLIDAEKKPNEEQRWTAVRQWIADKLSTASHTVELSEITENMALFLHNQVIPLTNELQEETAKLVFMNASSAQPIQESQPNS